MTDKEIKELLGRGSVRQYSLDPQMKSEITRATLDVAVREVKKALSLKKRVSVVIVVE